MRVINLKMYNFHRSNEYDHLWVPGNTFIIDGKERTHYNKETKNIPHINTILESLYSRLYYIDERMGSTPEERQSNFRIIQDQINYYERIVRELALEDARLKYAPFKPSRFTSIWLTKEKAIPFWEQTIKNSELFEVSVTGKLFRTNSSLLPNISNQRSYYELVRGCKNYWHPVVDLITSDSTKDEYLFQGKVKVLKKVEK